MLRGDQQTEPKPPQPIMGQPDTAPADIKPHPLCVRCNPPARPGCPAVPISEERNALGAGDTRLALEVIKTMADATLAVAEIAQLRATPVAAPAMAKNVSHPVTEQIAEPQQTSQRPRLGAKAPPVLVISERSGSISAELWDGMTEDELKELDAVLSGIVKQICVTPITWDAIGEVIDKELRKFGFQFCSAGVVGEVGWGATNDQSLSDIARVKLGLLSSKQGIGAQWYPDEMLRIVHRLMELRGFRP